MSELLYRAFLEKETELVNDIIQRLKRSTSRHYKEMDWESLLRRVESLVTYFMMSLRTNPVQFVDYVADIARVRISADYRLGELLMALRVLEEKAWEITVDSVPLEEQVRLLARVTGTVGAAKDRLAEIYVEHMEEAEEAARTWRQRYEDTLADGVGTEESAKTTNREV